MSTLKADTIQNTSGGAVTLTKQSAAKAWVRFDQTGTFTVNDSFNQSSMSDNGAGDATLTLVSAMSNANYSFSACSGNGATGTGTSFTAPKTDDPTTTNLRMIGVNYQNTNSDRQHNGWSILGDLA